jgi:hypothetical protein
MLLGFTKAGWQAIHTIFSYSFVILSIFHLFSFNWRVFVYYITSKAEKGINKKRELLVSVGLIAVVFLGTHFNLQPFKAVMDFGEWTTESWEVKEEQAPIPHAEILTIRELSGKYVKMSADSILLLIRGKGLKADSVGQTIQKIGELNNLTPAKVYSIILPETHTNSVNAEGKPQIQGLGRKTVSDLAKDLGKDVDEVISVLQTNNITAKPEDKIKEIAERTGKTPMEILGLLEK